MARAAARAVRARASTAPASRAPGTSRVAAGMLAPVTEADFGEEALLRVNLPAASAGRLSPPSSRSVSGLRRATARAARSWSRADRDDAEALRRLHDFQRALGLDVEWLRHAPLPRLEPGLSPRIAGGDPRRRRCPGRPARPVRALAGVRRTRSRSASRCEAIEHAGGRGDRRTHQRRARSSPPPWWWRPGRGAPALAAAARARRCARSRARSCALRDARRQWPLRSSRIVRTPRCYLVPRGDGRVILGATVEERGFDTAVTAGGVLPPARGGLRGACPRWASSSWWSARGRPAPGHARQRARWSGADAARRAWSGPPATSATASCWRRSPARSWRRSWRRAWDRRAELAALSPGRFERAGAQRMTKVCSTASAASCADGADRARRSWTRWASPAPGAASPSRSTARSSRAASGRAPSSRDGQRVEVLHAVQGGSPEPVRDRRAARCARG